MMYFLPLKKKRWRQTWKPSKLSKYSQIRSQAKSHHHYSTSRNFQSKGENESKRLQIQFQEKLILRARKRKFTHVLFRALALTQARQKSFAEGIRLSCILKMREYHSQFTLLKSCPRFRFGDYIHDSDGTVKVRIPFRGDGYLSFNVDVVKACTPLTIGINDLKAKKLLPKYLGDHIEHIHSQTSYPVRCKHGHSFLKWNYTNIFFTHYEVQRLHPHFLHPTSDELFQFLKRARPSRTDENVRKTLRMISRACEQCRELSVKPLWFRVSVSPDQLLFNHEVPMDLMWWEQTPFYTSLMPILHSRRPCC